MARIQGDVDDDDGFEWGLNQEDGVAFLTKNNESLSL